MFLLLLKARIRGLINVARHTAQRSRLTAVVLTLIGLWLFGVLFLGFHFILELAPGQNRVEMVYQLFYALFLFLLAGSVPFVSGTMLQAGDYLLLGSAPIAPHSIVAAKLVDATVTNSLQFAFLGVPAILACGMSLGLDIVGWIGLSVLIVLFVMLPVLLTSLALILGLRVFGPKRVRAAVTAVSAILAAVVCLAIVSQARNIRLEVHSPVGLASLAASTSPTVRQPPSGWFATALLNLGNGKTAEGAADIGRLGLLVASLYGLCMAFGGRLLSEANTSEESAPVGSVVSHSRLRPSRSGLLGLCSAPVAAIVAKDIRYVVRDAMLLSQLSAPIILFLVPFVLAIKAGAGSLVRIEDMYPISGVMVAIILFMQTSTLALSSIGLENRGFWLVLTSPNGGMTLLWAKFLMCTAVCTFVGFTLNVIGAIMFRAQFGYLLLGFAIITPASVALCGLGVGVSGALPRFIYENPAHRVSAWALVIGFFASAAYVLVVALIFAAALFAVEQPNANPPLIYAAAWAVFAVLSAACAVVPIAIGARRIEQYQWEH